MSATIDHPLAKRHDFLHDICQGATSIFLDAYYNVEWKNPQYLDPVREQPFVLLPKHQSMYDIFLEGKLLWDLMGRRGYYIMKAELPNFYTVIGAIKILRSKDKAQAGIPANPTPEQKREFLAKARSLKEQVYGCVCAAIDAGEAVVVHPEGTRNYHKAAPPKFDILRTLTSLPTKTDPIFVPLSFEYENQNRFRSRIIATIGESLQTRDAKSLEAHLLKWVPLLRKE